MEEKQNNPRPEEPRKEQANYLPLDISDQIDERAFEVYNALYQAWGVYQDRNTPKKAKKKARTFIQRLYAASGLARKGPKTGGMKEFVTWIYEEEMIPLARTALEEYREIIKEKQGMKTRGEAKQAAIDVIIEDLLGPEGKGSNFFSEKPKRERYRKEMEKWKWIDRRVDGLARDLTAWHLGISSNSVNVLRFRANRQSGGKR